MSHGDRLVPCPTVRVPSLLLYSIDIADTSALTENCVAHWRPSSDLLKRSVRFASTGDKNHFAKKIQLAVGPAHLPTIEHSLDCDPQLSHECFPLLGMAEQSQYGKLLSIPLHYRARQKISLSRTVKPETVHWHKIHSGRGRRVMMVKQLSARCLKPWRKNYVMSEGRFIFYLCSDIFTHPSPIVFQLISSTVW